MIIKLNEEEVKKAIEHYLVNSLNITFPYPIKDLNISYLDYANEHVSVYQMEVAIIEEKENE